MSSPDLSIEVDLDDRPQDWQVCFGLDDNPFSPSLQRHGIQLDRAMLETMPLCPHLLDYESLYPDYFAMEVDNFAGAYKEFYDVIRSRKLSGIQQGFVVLIHGSIGSGKTTFANLCRYLLINSTRRDKSRRILQFEMEMNNPNFNLQTIDDISKTVANQLAKEVSKLLPDKIVTSSLEELASESRKIGGLKLPSTLTLILLDDLTSKAMKSLQYTNDTVFLFLSDLNQQLRQFLTPIIFATTDDEVMFQSFLNKPIGSKTDGVRLKLGELSGHDVVRYVDERVKLFRSQDQAPPADIPMFPFKAEIIQECFIDLKSDRGSGSLPFRNVNRILASALRVKKEEVMELSRNSISRLDASACIVGKDNLDSAIQQHVKEFLP